MQQVITSRVAKKAEQTIYSGCSPLLSRIYQARGIKSAQELDYRLQHLLPYQELKGIAQAVTRLMQAIKKQERILIVGDFDADGATSTSIAVRGLRGLGAKKVDFLVPNRFNFGYGLSVPLVHKALEIKQPSLIITVDNGISSIEGVQAANKAGVDVVVTDHHLAGPELPAAVAIVNPNQPNCAFASKALAGVGVMFYCLMALRSALRAENWFSKDLPELNLANLLDIVALGTVADVVSLDYNNRILVQQGIHRIRAGRACAGINALLAVSKRNFRHLTSQDLGFALGPRLNAAGRLEDMSLGIECLITDDPIRAQQIAEQLNTLNTQRQAIGQDMEEQAFTVLHQLSQEDKQLPRGLCLYDQHWHQGVVGILASRVKEKLNRPVLCCTKVSETEIKGSARSIDKCHIRDVIANIDNQNPGLITKFGGHAMAAGVSLPPANIEAFKRAFATEVGKQVSEVDLQPEILTDGVLLEDELTFVTAQELQQAGPWGKDFPEPLFTGEFRVEDSQLIQNKHLKLILNYNNNQVSAIYFNVPLESWDKNATLIKVVYQLTMNEFRQLFSMQLILRYLKVLDKE